MKLHRLTTVIAGLALAFVAAPSAHADTPPAAEQAYVSHVAVDTNPSAKLVTGLIFQLSQNGGKPVAGTSIHVSTFSCGRFLQESTRTYDDSNDLLPVAFSPNGGLDSSSNSVNRLVSKTVEYQIDVLQPGFDGYHLTGSIADYGTVDGKPLSSYRPSCEELAGGGVSNACAVKKQAKTVGQARVGHTVKVREPKTNGQCGKTSYTWKANGKTVKTGKTLHITQHLKGKNLTVKVSLSNGPDKTLRFGNAK